LTGLHAARGLDTAGLNEDTFVAIKMFIWHIFQILVSRGEEWVLDSLKHEESESDFFIRLRNHFLHRTLILIRACWNGTIFRNFYWSREFLLCTTISIDCWLLQKLLTTKLHSRYVKESESEILERSESDISPPTTLLVSNDRDVRFQKSAILNILCRWCTLVVWGRNFHLWLRHRRMDVLLWTCAEIQIINCDSDRP